MTQIIRIEMPIPYPVKWVNCYYVADSVPALIDPGINTEESFQALSSALEGLGASVADIRKIIVTHGHLDHAGLAGRIQAESGAEIFIHSLDSTMNLAGPSRGAMDVGEDYRRFFLRAGVPEATASEVVELVMARVRNFVFPCAKESPLVDGHKFVFDERTLEVVWTPGHSPGSACLFDRAEGMLFSGDTLLQEIFHNPAQDSNAGEGLGFSPLSEHLASLIRLKSLPVRKVMPGHGATFSNRDRRVQHIMGHHERRSREVLQIVRAYCDGRGLRSGVTPFAVAADLFPGMRGMDVFFGVSAAWGHLDFLKRQGLIAAVPHRSQDRYSLVQEVRSGVTNVFEKLSAEDCR
jgi:glyoxylase-like metal-dependent hydrolase (beta-lactamase superfamily II)